MISKNRTIIRKVTPKLWREPFAFLEHSSPVLIRTYISCFSDKERDSLYNYGLKIKIKYKPSLFSYPSFLNEFDFWPLKTSTEEWVDSLSSQAHSIVSIRLEDTDLTDVSSKGLMMCSNLKTLELLDCRTNDPNIFWEPFVLNSKIRLSKLTLVRVPINPKVIEIILKDSCMDLEEITFDKIVVESIPEILNILKSYCTNITYLKIFIIKYYFTQKLFKIIPSFTKLKSLIIRNSRLSFGNQFDKLGFCLPKSLRLFDMDLEISAFTLKRFLLNCSSPLERLILNYSVGFTNEHLEVILKYAKAKRNLKSIGFTYRSLPELFIPSFISEATEAKVKKFIEIYDPDDQDDCLF
ncbi:hypothetical protein RhiirA5_475138 [Rhizophagus irregularis]|uniref:F-box domain-containing protein n=1 Tax=Rhizophagus irregularis TaxID=588596 RepID=A0A2N0PQS1_9GLOM|nr:hypothetical protein RhiirA5_475138 [Rhizophagus irregularis]